MRAPAGRGATSSGWSASAARHAWRADRRPGRLAAVLDCVADAEANVLEVYHHRKGLHLPVGQVEVELLLETRDAAHAQGIFAALKAAGYAEQAPEAAGGPGPATRRFAAREALQ